MRSASYGPQCQLNCPASARGKSSAQDHRQRTRQNPGTPRGYYFKGDANLSGMPGGAITTSLHTAPAFGPEAGLGYIRHSYNDKWSCPLTPAENRLTVAIRAGEKVFEGAGHE